MPLTRFIGFGLSIVLVVTILSSASSAQNRRALRWLGEGFSDGYHQCNPGPNSDYYNPYSAHNSRLYSQPSGNGNYQGTWQAGQIETGVPFTVYAAPAPVNNTPTFNALPGEVIDNSFVPYDENVKPVPPENTWQEKAANPDEADAEGSDEIEDNDNSAFVPSVNGRFLPGSARSKYSKTGFQSQPIGTIIQETTENSSNLFNPFADEN